MRLQLGDLEIHGITEIEQFDVPLDFMFPEIVTLLRETTRWYQSTHQFCHMGRCI